MSRYRKPGSSTKTDTANVRCAIYSRKSSEEGLDLEFNSLDAQPRGLAALAQCDAPRT